MVPDEPKVWLSGNLWDYITEIPKDPKVFRLSGLQELPCW
jgi:hypothetical protein